MVLSVIWTVECWLKRVQRRSFLCYFGEECGFFFVLVHKVCLCDILNTDKVLFLSQKEIPVVSPNTFQAMALGAWKVLYKYVLVIFLIPATKCLAGRDWIVFGVLRSAVAWLTWGSHAVVTGVWCIACSCLHRTVAEKRVTSELTDFLLSHFTQSGTLPHGMVPHSSWS